jgi:hypothetical protein
MNYIDADKLIAEIERRIARLDKELKPAAEEDFVSSWASTANNKRVALQSILSFIASLQQEQPEVDLYNNGWIDCRKQMPKETKQWSDTLQGHRECTESKPVLAWDSMYGCRVDATKNGKWMSEQRDGYTGQVVHGIIAWRPIQEFNEELLLNARKEE